jgi:beta-glucosidase
MKMRFSFAARPALLCVAVFAFLSFTTACAGKPKQVSGIPGALYMKADAPVEQRVEDLLARMTIEEKIGQMTQIAMDGLQPTAVKGYFLGSVLSGGGGSPRGNNTPEGWADMIDGFQRAALSTRLGIPIIYGVDAVHGHNNLAGATIFPHNIGLGAAGDADLVERIGKAVAIETAATGVPWTFGPCLAVGRDPRWGRFYESFGQDSTLVAKLGTAFVKGYQEADVGGVKTATTVKHFLGDGGTAWGSSKTNNYRIDQGDTRGDDAYLRSVLLPPYADALKAGARTVMTSFSSWNGLKMHAQKKLVTDLLKGELGFTGFVVSDWAGMDQIDRDYYKAIVTGINAGIDMNMVPNDAFKFISTMKKAVANKDVPMERIDDAVRRILRVKFEMGLFEKPFANRALAKEIRSTGHLALAREAVAKSQVVLVNRDALPLAKTGGKVYVAGAAAHDIGMQCGGWTITWQGMTGEITKGTSVFDGICEIAGKDRVVFDVRGDFKDADRKDPVILVTGEMPYAEGVGDNGTLNINPQDYEVALALKAKFDHVILVVVSGRPLVLGDLPAKLDGVVAAWLPGSEGAGVADVLFGNVKPTGKLPFAWQKSVEQLPIDRFISDEQKPEWPAGYGLSW